MKNTYDVSIYMTSGKISLRITDISKEAILEKILALNPGVKDVYIKELKSVFNHW